MNPIVLQWVSPCVYALIWTYLGPGIYALVMVSIVFVTIPLLSHVGTAKALKSATLVALLGQDTVIALLVFAITTIFAVTGSRNR